MAAGDIIMSQASGGQPSFPCGNCGRCHDKYGDSLTVILSGILLCSGCYTFTFDGHDYSATFTGVNGSYTATWTGSGWQNLNIGTVTLTQWSSTDGSCSGSTTTGDVNAALSVTCTGDNVFTVFVSATASANLFIGTGAASGITNSYVVGNCGNNAGELNFGYDGTATIS